MNDRCLCCWVMFDLIMYLTSRCFVTKVREPGVHSVTGQHEIAMLESGKTMICPVGPRTEKGMDLLDKAKAAGINLLAVDCIPRVSRAQVCFCCC